jgi:hypothetical protein
VSRSTFPTIDPAGIAKGEILHGAGEGNLTNLNDQMQMLCEASTYVKFPFPLL